MDDPCKVDPLTLTVDTGCQWDRAVTLWNAGVSGKVTTILIVAALVTLAVVAIRMAAEVWQETRPAANRRR
jgi:hypothetical protein